jgi:hypothetical protein
MLHTKQLNIQAYELINCQLKTWLGTGLHPLHLLPGNLHPTICSSPTFSKYRYPSTTISTLSSLIALYYGINSLVTLSPCPTWVSSNRQWWVCSTSFTPSVFKLFYLLSSWFTINILTMTRIHFQSHLSSELFFFSFSLQSDVH